MPQGDQPTVMDGKMNQDHGDDLLRFMTLEIGGRTFLLSLKSLFFHGFVAIQLSCCTAFEVEE